MSLNNIFDISGSALVAETARLKTSASNMSNADVVTGSADEVYRAQYPIFTAVQEEAQQWMDSQTKAGVALSGVYESNTDAVKRFEPNHPLADKEGFVYAPNINSVEEMANIISSSRAYEMGVSVLNTTKQLIQRTLQLGE
ncbi:MULTISPECIES: flagellar basal body rod protein FlgC [Legionella]|uniref:Flagellar basal-body rod protein FlgC n=1 Tax=Legionella drozanskii LLAP-1 TaxID=1212489 RepID=A0A0W0SQQ1_9GAMM|nr:MULTISPECIES: flagellar basal body rod protein FlgC [Legionella]KTC85549.1 flagellar basal body rod protein FlgC [Legionella drozanskii LLAP-1]PJE15596.1 MAG: flagellar basal body rod protein FlgC [Legionella sp.]